MNQGGDSQCCPECWDLAGIDNDVNDGARTWAQVAPACNDLLNDLISKGGDAGKAKASFDYLWPKEG